MRKITREEALEYHSRGRKGKVEVVPSKPCRTQEDLSLAYSPGVAEPCLEIARDPETVYDYTAKGNLVAVISNGTAVLGLGDIGPLASKPVMEGKGVLFKRFADIDVFDIEVDARDPQAFIDTVAAIAPTFGGINLEDVKAPECFVIEEELKKRLKIPVFHDDQHGTAIISAAALLNALEIAGKKIGDAKVVFLGAGASAIACAKLYLAYGVKKENLRMVDKSGVIRIGRQEDMNEYKAQFAVKTDERTLTDALDGADVLVGLSGKGLVKGEMLKNMARDPIVFALANPEPEITPEEARAARPDVIMATGRSDYPNQVNNVLGFPFIFRGALDVRATEINEEMKKAASQALAALAKMDVPDSVSKAYGGQEFRFGREYLIPKPFDYRVLLWVAPAVAEAAMMSGVARKPVTDMAAYLRRLEAMLSRAREVMGVVIRKARQDPKRIVFPEGEHPKILRAAKILAEEGICRPILLAREEEVSELARELQLPMDKIEFVHARSSPRLPDYARLLEERRRRRGMTAVDAAKQAGSRNVYGPLMVEAGDADGVISGLTQHYPETIRPALEIVGTAPGVRRVSGLYVLDLQGPDVLLRGHDSQHRPDRGGAGGDRAPDGRRRPALRNGAADRDDLVLELRLQHARERAEGEARRRDRQGRAAGPTDRRRDAGGLRDRAGAPRSGVPLGDGPPPERPHLPGPPVGQRRVQARVAPRRGRGDRPDPPRHAQARARAAARGRGRRHREHGRDRCRRRAGEGGGGGDASPTELNQARSVAESITS